MDTPLPPSKPTILVVDDTPDNLLLMNSLLKDEYQVKIVNSGEKALKIAASDTPPDLILLDIMMPEMDGYEVCRRLKQDPGTADIPVIFLTAKAALEDETMGLELGAVDYITKPVSPPIVLARVKNHLALKSMADFLRNRNDILELEVQKRTGEVLASREIALKNRQLEEASRMKSEFLANMSHELRTPLNAIIGFSEVLRDGLLGELAPRQTEYINDIFNSGSHLLLLINDILDLSKVEAGKMTLELEPVHVASLVRAGLQVVREKAMIHRLRLTTEIADNLGDIWLDERKVKQILYNLLSNAVKFTPEGGAVHVIARPAGADVLPEGGFQRYLELVVSDNGIGISAADQERLFRPFTQIDSKLARRYEGTGLGLAMVKRLAELHGGAVVLKSAPDQGSSFTVWLPWRTEAETPASAGEAALPPPAAIAAVAMARAVAADLHQQPLALIVEDDDQGAELLRRQLESTGFRVSRAVTAESALALAHAECPDLLTLDIMLPGMNGWEFLERFKAMPQFAAVPVVIVSIVADRKRGLSLGAAHVLQKPVGREELAQALAVGLPVGANDESLTATIATIANDSQPDWFIAEVKRAMAGKAG